MATAAAWAALNRPVHEPAWPAYIDGFAFSPLTLGSDPTRDEYPSSEEIAADLRLIARSGGSVRTYSLDGSLKEIPAIAAGLGLDTTVGVWLDGDASRNELRLRDLRDLVANNPGVSRVIVGNETLLRADLSTGQLSAILDRLRAELDVEIGTAEPWHIWIEHPELAHHVDFIAVHLLPYWEGIGVDDAVDYIAARVSDLQATFGDKPIVIAEVGWPSWGRARGEAVPSRVNAATFLRRFSARAEQEGYEYFLMEAFDQPWKRADEGEVGAYWGVFDADRQPKFAQSGPIVPVPQWRLLAALSTVLAGAAFCVMVADGRRLRARGRVFLAITAAVVTSTTVWNLNDFTHQYWTPTAAISAAVLMAGLLGIIALFFAEAHELTEARWCARKTRPSVKGNAADVQLPKVSIHVPAYKEPPLMVVDTLRALAELDYPRFEVIVIDNNTADEKLWRPLEACCAQLGDRFRFFHVAPLDGYKAGALNYALRHTAEDAEIIAVVDSDYEVHRHWLRDLVPHFANPTVGIVQAPQAYRDGGSRPFKAMCEAEYRGFFKIGMVTRNERNAIIQHGTMTMLRRRVLSEVGGWAEWTITEDAELGLRVLEHGHEAVYTPQCYGRGLTPDNFQDYKAQRFRWALGAIQILRRHRKRLLGIEPSRLSLGQRYHFVAGWLAWLADGFNLLFNIVAVAWSTLMIVAPFRFFPPLATLSGFVLALFVFKLAKMIYLYRTEVGASVLDTLGAAVAGLALVYTVGRAVIAGIFSTEARFCRTPKLADRHSFAGAISASLGETLLAAALLASATGVSMTSPFPGIDTTTWCVLLVTLAIPHLSSLALSMISALPLAPTECPARRSMTPSPMPDPAEARPHEPATESNRALDS